MSPIAQSENTNKSYHWHSWLLYFNTHITLPARQSPYHEIPNGPVEDCPIVVAFFTQADKVLSSFGNLVTKEIKTAQLLLKWPAEKTHLHSFWLLLNELSTLCSIILLLLKSVVSCKISKQHGEHGVAVTADPSQFLVLRAVCQSQ